MCACVCKYSDGVNYVWLVYVCICAGVYAQCATLYLCVSAFLMHAAHNDLTCLFPTTLIQVYFNYAVLKQDLYPSVPDKFSAAHPMDFLRTHTSPVSHSHVERLGPFIMTHAHTHTHMHMLMYTHMHTNMHAPSEGASTSVGEGKGANGVGADYAYTYTHL